MPRKDAAAKEGEALTKKVSSVGGRRAGSILVAVTLILSARGPAAGADVRELDLERCVEIALEQNRRRPASQQALVAAEARHRQALSGYWPQLAFEGGFQRLDEAPNFVFPASSFAVPAQSLSLPAGTAVVNLPAGAFGPGFPPVDVSLPVGVPGQRIDLPAQQLSVPEQDISVMDEQSWFASVKAQWLLWDGGLRRGLREQSQAGIDAARENLRQTELEIVDTVTRHYWGAVLASQLRRVGEDTLARMEATLRLTESLYTEGSGTVTRADYLDTKVVVESLRSAVALLEKNGALAEAALAFDLGLEWHASVRPLDTEIPYEPIAARAENLVLRAYGFSPDWKRLEAGIRAAEGRLRETRSGRAPRLALTGDLHRWWNDFDTGLVTDANEQGWSLGLGLQIPIFQGYRVRGEIDEARARLEELEEQRALLREGIGLALRDLLLGLEAAEKRHQATFAAMVSATENRELNTRAYQSDLVETEDVIRAQLMEALMSAQHYRMRFDHVELRSRLNRVVGTKVARGLPGDE